MTWTKLSDDFADDCARAGLSSEAFRTHVEALLWSMRRETGGVITERDIRRFAEAEDVRAAIEELVDAAFWDVAEDGYTVVHHMEHQPEPDVIDRRRKLTAERVRRHRRKKAGLSEEDSGNAVTDGATERVTRDGTGRDGTGRENTSHREQETLGTGDSWPSVPSVTSLDSRRGGAA